MKKRTILILTILAVGLLMWKWLACGYNPDKPTEFYPILTRLNDGMKHEAFVVSNAPCDTCELRKMVEKYDIETLPLDTLEKYESISRTYYKETKYMTKDFKEGEEYDPVFSTWDNIQDFRNHIDDILMDAPLFGGHEPEIPHGLGTLGLGLQERQQICEPHQRTFPGLEFFCLCQKEAVRA